MVGPFYSHHVDLKLRVHLIKNPRMVISRDELLSEVWGYENYLHQDCRSTFEVAQETRNRACPSQALSTVHSAGVQLSYRRLSIRRS